MKDALMGFLFGVAMAAIGVSAFTLQFWLIFAIVLVWRFVVAEART